ncbi:HD domain-containing protein [Candidatus Woesearchaeota archaeon]|nr:MAG: HD domain-containing protein [Candidatus Woesearchaeota archaeon]
MLWYKKEILLARFKNEKNIPLLVRGMEDSQRVQEEGSRISLTNIIASFLPAGELKNRLKVGLNLNRRFERFWEEVEQRIPGLDKSYVREAWDFAERGYRGVYRQNGAPFLEHAERTAIYYLDILNEYLSTNENRNSRGLKPEVGLRAALGHDLLEKNPKITPELIESELGIEERIMIEGMSVRDEEVKRWGDTPNGIYERCREKFGRAKENSKYVLDIMLIKIADRRHNMETLDAKSPGDAQRIAADTIWHYVREAFSLRLGETAEKLIDLSSRYIRPSSTLMRGFCEYEGDKVYEKS